MTITNSEKISTPVLTSAEAERVKAKGGSRKAAAPKSAAPKAAAPKKENPFARHEAEAQEAIESGLDGVSPETVRKVVDTARSRAHKAYMAALEANSLAALDRDQSRKQKSFMDKVSIATLLGKL
jgi:hypothetical protein